MFANLPDKNARAKKVTKALSNYPKNKSHDRHFHIEDCEKMGLTIKHLEDDPTMQDLVLTVHHCYMNVMMNTNAFKIIENHKGVALIKQVAPPAPGAATPKQAVE